MKKLISIVGARPQFVKAAVVSKALKKYRADLTEFMIHTGQHYDFNMSEVFFKELNIANPYINLNVGSSLHGEQTAEMLRLIEIELNTVKPQAVLVYGDTNSTLAGALAASKLHIPVYHVEAGLRSFNKKMPEEINRILTDHVSSVLFAPTSNAILNLEKEGISRDSIFFTGDVMYDAVKIFGASAQKKSATLQHLGLQENEFILVTIHRAENTNDQSRLKTIFQELAMISKRHKVLFPVHPRTLNILKTFDDFSHSDIQIIEPVGYFDMQALQASCRIIVTDSGGVQKEAFFNKKQCITVREETEWTELIETGNNQLAKPLNSLKAIIENALAKNFVESGNLYGDGTASDNIADIIAKTI